MMNEKIKSLYLWLIKLDKETGISEESIVYKLSGELWWYEEDANLTNSNIRKYRIEKNIYLARE